MARRPLPSFPAMWARHESLYAEVFTSALQELGSRPSVTGDEDAVSESLCPILSAVCLQINQDKDMDVPVPQWETPRQPASKRELTGGKKRKRPDFTCALCDPSARCAEEYQIPFHIECKLLGNPTSPSWILNRNYVKNGIQRFDNRTHEYGKRASSGMMVGYVISMSPKCVLGEVNNHIGQFLPTYPAIVFTSSKNNVSSTEQNIVRQNVAPAEFQLKHIWIDLRHNYQ